MKPLLAQPSRDRDEIVDWLVETGRLVRLNTESELRQYEAGELVLYGKPMRDRTQLRYTDQEGVEHRLVQQTAFPE